MGGTDEEGGRRGSARGERGREGVKGMVEVGAEGEMEEGKGEGRRG